MSNPKSQTASFTTTCWSEVRRAVSLTGQAGESLERLCAAYWHPLYAYLRRSGHDPETAKDYVQSFFLDLLSRDSLRLADPQRGRFRSFLLTACRNHVANLLRPERKPIEARLINGTEPSSDIGKRYSLAAAFQSAFSGTFSKMSNST